MPCRPLYCSYRALARVKPCQHLPCHLGVRTGRHIGSEASNQAGTLTGHRAAGDDGEGERAEELVQGAFDLSHETVAVSPSV
jgi:hypothetical protein